MLDGIAWFFQNIAYAFYNFGYAVLNPGTWLNWSDPESLMRFVYYGGSVEFFFVVFTLFLVVTAIGIAIPSVMWGMVRGLEGFGNTVGRVAAWAGLLMVLQQIIVVFIQRVFADSQLSLGFGSAFTRDISWWSEELKLYNAIIVCLCCAYTFVQGGHVRVDLVYSAVGYRTRRLIDMFGSLFFIMPMAVLIWLYGWFFMWRHLITPKVNSTDTLERTLLKARAVRWNVETVGFSPNGFDAYFLFKVLMVAFAGMIFLQGVAFFYRSYREFVEGEASENKYLDKDRLDDPDAELVAEIH
ncbi:MAG: TRAP transporter small permease subunit [Rhodobacteraceae bacterium]|nr:TRAP transporter small permease subunit [Alphaproteobacteria bacterium]NNK68241.1 TRAP transporter small permease subunit [Paracoccaceae bacterium]